MNALLDAHTMIWAVDQPAHLGAAAGELLVDPANNLLLSAGTIWEIAIKVGLGRLTLSRAFREWMVAAIDDLGISVLPIKLDHADIQSGLPFHHRDPFDRLLVAQAILDHLPIISADPLFDSYGVSRIWK